MKGARLIVDDKTHERLKTMAKFNGNTLEGETYKIIFAAYNQRKTWRKVNERNATESF